MLKGHVVEFVLVDGDRRIDVVVELGELIHVFPHWLERRVEDVRAIFMHVDAIDLFGVDIAADMIAAIDDQAGLSGSFRLMREHGTREASPHDKIIVMGKRWLQNYRHRRILSSCSCAGGFLLPAFVYALSLS